MSIHSSRSRGYSSSMSHRSNMSRNHSSMSHRSSFSHSSMSHRSGISHGSSMSHRSSISHRSHSGISSYKSTMHGGIGHSSSIHKHSGIKSHRSMFKHHGISDAHAFAVGKATGVNINASARGAHGAALHRMKKMRDSAAKHRVYRSKTGFKNSTGFSNSGLRKIRLSHDKKRYYSKKYDFDAINNVQEIFNQQFNGFNKYFGVIFVFIIFVLIAFLLFSIMSSNFGRVGLMR